VNKKLWLAHPDYNSSIANKTVVNTLKELIPTLEVRHLDTLYPDFKIDIQAEQRALLEADTIILQYPMFWVGMPSMMLHWKEKVFHEGFGYYPPDASQKSALHGKKLIISLTAGAPETAYSKEGFIEEDFSAYTPTIKAIATFTGMKLLGIFCFFNARITSTTSLEELQKNIKDHTIIKFNSVL